MEIVARDYIATDSLKAILTSRTVGTTVTLTVQYPTALPESAVYLKYGPISHQVSPHWYQLPATFAGNTATFNLAGGGLGDDGLIADGKLVEPAGPAVLVTQSGLPRSPMSNDWPWGLAVTLVAA